MTVAELCALLEEHPDYYDVEIGGRPVEEVSLQTYVRRGRDRRTGAGVTDGRCVVTIA